MKFVFAPDSFKGSLSAQRVCALLEEAAKRHYPQAATDSIPIADGGEGTAEALVLATRGRFEWMKVTGPLGMPVMALYGILGDGETAVIETAQASGLILVPTGQRNPLAATSYGTGELIAHVLARGYRKLLIGLGGSATNDAGMGMLTALGARFLDCEGNPLRGSGGVLERVVDVDFSGLLPALREARMTVLSDVSNPLLGENGATAVYGPQKGADEPMLRRLEAGMTRFAGAVEAATCEPFGSQAGAGAAGGMGAAFASALKAALRPGIATVLDIVDFDGRIRDASLVITGEGRIDGQSIRFGKAAAGVAKRCALHDVPVIALAGGMGEGAEELYALAESSIMTTINGAMDIRCAIENAEALFASVADRLFRLLRIGGRL